LRTDVAKLTSGFRKAIKDEFRHEITISINSRKETIYYSIHKMLLPSLFFEAQKIKAHKTTVLPLVLYDCQTGFFT
jgi:hypothetical protein